MPAIADIIINKPRAKVWSIITDPSTHAHWLGAEHTTIYESELAEGMKFSRVEIVTGAAIKGEVVSVKSEEFLKVRVDLEPEMFNVSEYHLVALGERCALRFVWEVFDTGDKRHAYWPEVAEQQLQEKLEKLKSYCEA